MLKIVATSNYARHVAYSLALESVWSDACTHACVSRRATKWLWQLLYHRICSLLSYD